MTQPILLQVSDGLARITLDRPARLNAFDVAMAHAWADATTEATSRDDVRAILVDAAGPSFCAGGDVIEMARVMTDLTQMQAMADVIHSGIRALHDAPVPVVAAAQGTTAGGGLGILLASDYAVVAPDSRIGCLYAKIGLTPDLSVSAQLAAAVGERRALALALTERMLSAAEALEWGLVAEEAPDVGARAADIARGWIEGASGAYGQAKRLLRSRETRSFAEHLDEEARTIAAAFGTPDAVARIRAFGEASARRGG